jgi:hypothetical protein
MYNSLLFGFVGPVMLAAGFGFLFAGKEYMKEFMKRVINNPGFLLLFGMLTLVFGLTVLKFNLPTKGNLPSLVMQFIGIASLIKGALMLSFPKIFQEISKKYATNQNWYQFGEAFWMLVGFWFTWGHYVGF